MWPIISAMISGVKFNPGGRWHIGPGKQKRQNVWPLSSKARGSSVMQQDADTLWDTPFSSALHTHQKNPLRSITVWQNTKEVMPTADIVITRVWEHSSSFCISRISIGVQWGHRSCQRERVGIPVVPGLWCKNSKKGYSSQDSSAHCTTHDHSLETGEDVVA